MKLEVIAGPSSMCHKLFETNIEAFIMNCSLRIRQNVRCCIQQLGKHANRKYDWKTSGSDYLEDLCINGRIILKLTF
jgi:hypothetical protein